MESRLAPIIVFAYNRPAHVKKTLDSLAANEEASRSVLYIYCDGAKELCSDADLNKVVEVRKLAHAENRFKKVVVIEQIKNKGLANSIIDGVTEVVNKHNLAIILEDDIVPSCGFLRYMNEALNLYKDDFNVGCIHSWNYHLNTETLGTQTFFLKGADCWGWAVWKRSWDLFNPDGSALLKEVKLRNAQFEFDRRDTHSFTEMLQGQVLGKNDSWAIRWHASLFLGGKYCLHPSRPIAKNIGFDNSGVHCGIETIKQEPVDFIDVVKEDVKESEWFFKEYVLYVKGCSPAKPTLWGRLKKQLKRLPLLY